MVNKIGSPILAALLIQHRWKQYLSRFACRPQPQAETIQANRKCVLVGGPPALDTALVYTSGEVAKICDALVEPLAKEMHCLEELDVLLGNLAPKSSTHTLGGLLQDICTKVVPLTAVLQERRDIVHRLRQEHLHPNGTQASACKVEAPQSHAAAPGIDFTIGQRLRIKDPDLLPKFRREVATLVHWSSPLQKWCAQWDSDRSTTVFYTHEELVDFGTPS